MSDALVRCRQGRKLVILFKTSPPHVAIGWLFVHETNVFQHKSNRFLVSIMRHRLARFVATNRIP